MPHELTAAALALACALAWGTVAAMLVDLPAVYHLAAEVELAQEAAAFHLEENP